MATKIDIMGRIDDLESIDTLDKLKANVNELYSDDEVQPDYSGMFEPLGLMPGTYMVTGIEGKNYDGYVSGKDLVDGVWVDAPNNDTPWPLQVTSPEQSAFDIMVLVTASEFNGYPDVNHVWFEMLEVDVLAMTLKFHMGS